MFCTQCQAGVLSSSKSIDFSLFPEVSIRLNLSSLGVDKDGLQSKCWSITGSQITNCVKHISRFKFLVQLKGALWIIFWSDSPAQQSLQRGTLNRSCCGLWPALHRSSTAKCWYDDNSCRHVKNDDDTKKKSMVTALEVHWEFLNTLMCVQT